VSNADASPDPLETARKRGSRYLTIAFATFATAFMLLSVGQLVMGVFGVGFDAFRLPGPAPLAAGACAGELRGLEAAIGRALGAASRAGTDEKAVTTYRSALSPEWDEETAVATTCDAEPHGREAYAAVLRLRRGGEDLARRQVVELAPLRQNVSAYLPALAAAPVPGEAR
jgi:hypothetical protein